MVSLRQFTNADFDRLISWADTEEILLQFAGGIFTFPLTKDQLDNYLTDKNRFAFCICEEDCVIGHAEIYYNAENKSAKLCRILIGDEAARGKGYGLETMKKLEEFALKQFDIREMELNVYDWNIAAIRCYEKAGFSVNPSKNKIVLFKGEEWRAINYVRIFVS